MVIKTLLGLGFGFTTLGIFSLPFHWTFNTMIFIICVWIAGSLSFIRVKRMIKVCDDCKETSSIADCTYLKEIGVFQK
ncbi:MAG: hypothetical protein JSW00_12270 [Thermoplasmata archaeon]|nr:MAG: hypothetical protein JSW00_12270 [Thermoplasmata archaeon]